MKSVRPDGNVLARPVGCPQAEYMIASKAAGEVPVCPGVIEVVMRIVGTTTMSDPLIVLGVNVRHVRMPFLVHGNVVLGRGSRRLTPCRGRSSRRLGSVRGSWTVSGKCPPPTAGWCPP